MNIGIDGLVEEIITTALENAGVSSEVIDKVIDDIHYQCKETNFMHNEVANSNWYAAEEKKENQKVIDAKKELEKAEKEHQKELKDRDYEIRRLRNKLQDNDGGFGFAGQYKG